MPPPKGPPRGSIVLKRATPSALPLAYLLNPAPPVLVMLIYLNPGPPRGDGYNRR